MWPARFFLHYLRHEKFRTSSPEILQSRQLNNSLRRNRLKILSDSSCLEIPFESNVWKTLQVLWNKIFQQTLIMKLLQCLSFWILDLVLELYFMLLSHFITAHLVKYFRQLEQSIQWNSVWKLSRQNQQTDLSKIAKEGLQQTNLLRTFS